jgi:predicted TIM-barrel fold metal-dependent hydrolase
MNASASAGEGGPRGKAGKAQRIDVHHHVLPPAYLEATRQQRLGEFTPEWSPQRSIDDMDANGIATSVTSLIQPQVWFDDLDLGRRLAREANDYAATLARDHPGRFGMFAVIPLPDTAGSLREIEYALDVLKADGIALMTSYANRWLGDPAFWPVLDELNRRRAVVYTHPLAPACCKNLVPGIPDPVIEYATDTTRTIASLLFSGTAARYPDIRWIFSHAGGTMPFLLSRFVRQEASLKDARDRLPHGVMHELKRFHYDLAQAHHAGALSAQLEIAPVSQLLFGTDFPFRTGADIVAGLSKSGFSRRELRAIERGNALELMPRLDF